MTPTDDKPSVLKSLGIFLAIAGWLAFAALGVNHIMRSVRGAFAREQIGIFDEARLNASRAGVRDAAEALSYLVGYYPSGTKQEAGSDLDFCVEYARAAAMREIIGRLRGLTGEDLGERPEPWIRRFAGNQAPGGKG